MKAALSLLFVLMISVSAVAHPGKTDRRGGHTCWKNCGEWELLRGEYHLHDEYGKPIRLDQKGADRHVDKENLVPEPEKSFLLEGPSLKPAQQVIVERKIPEERAVSHQPSIDTHDAENILPFASLLLLLLAVLLLLLLIMIRRKKEER